MDAETRMRLETIQRELEDLKSLLLSQTSAEPIYTIKQLCALAGITRPGLLKMWDRGGLNIPEPRMRAGVRPLYSQKDVLAIKQAQQRRHQ